MSRNLSIFLMVALMLFGCHKTYSLDAADSGAGGGGDNDTNTGADADADVDADADSDTDTDTDVDTETEPSPMIEACWATSILGPTSEGTDTVALALTDGNSLVFSNFLGDVTLEPGKPEEVTFIFDEFWSNGFAALYGPNGALAWARHISSVHMSHVNAAAELPNGDVVIAGGFIREVTLNPQDPEPTELTSDFPLFNDIFIARFTVDGHLVWARRDGGEDDEASHALAGLPDGSILLAGEFGSNGLLGQGEENETVLLPTQTMERRVFLAKYKPDGLLDWAKTIDLNSMSSEILVRPDGSFLVRGTFWGPQATLGEGEPNETTFYLDDGSPEEPGYPPGVSASVLACYAPNGDLRWARGIARSADDLYGMGSVSTPGAAVSGDSIIVSGNFAEEIRFLDPDGDDFILKAWNCNSEDELCPAAFTAQYDMNGELVETKMYPIHSESGYSCRTALFSDQTLAVYGSFEDELVFDPGGPDETKLMDTEIAAYFARYKKTGTLDFAGRVCSNCWLDEKSLDISDDGSAILSANFEDFQENDISITLKGGETIAFAPVPDRGNVLLVRLCPES